MTSYVSLSQKIRDSLINFLQLYPIYAEYQREILDLTEKRITSSDYRRDRGVFEQQVVEYQLDADITVELTMAAMQIKTLAETDLPLSSSKMDRGGGRANDALCESESEGQ